MIKMGRYFNKNFFKFVLRFIVIITVSLFLVSIAVILFEQ